MARRQEVVTKDKYGRDVTKGNKGKDYVDPSESKIGKRSLADLARSVKAKAETQADAIEAPEGAEDAPPDQPVEPGGKVTPTPSPTPDPLADIQAPKNELRSERATREKTNRQRAWQRAQRDKQKQ